MKRLAVGLFVACGHAAEPAQVAISTAQPVASTEPTLDGPRKTVIESMLETRA